MSGGGIGSFALTAAALGSSNIRIKASPADIRRHRGTKWQACESQQTASCSLCSIQHTVTRSHSSPCFSRLAATSCALGLASTAPCTVGASAFLTMLFQNPLRRQCLSTKDLRSRMTDSEGVIPTRQSTAVAFAGVGIDALVLASKVCLANRQKCYAHPHGCSLGNV